MGVCRCVVKASNKASVKVLRAISKMLSSAERIDTCLNLYANRTSVRYNVIIGYIAHSNYVIQC